MRYAISYVSSAARDLSETEINDVLKESEIRNNQKDITGLLLYSEGNFFQVIEGEKEIIKSLYSDINKDSRHFNLIKLFEKTIQNEAYDGYKSDFISEDARYGRSDFKYYQHYLEVLDKPAKQATSQILRAFIQ
ncbi:BLUF domain-containing protein [Christiangramia sp. SM2212]|uniref:BLUF domain-containing protein n=1 Tax=Christiangramia sediminicola TaxID=3073267 RepID=A0ABU1EME1_9FLAO|nr:BLUF domain-containing protein [Christiangramia sp. SM2212]MDR5589550.1 BLUF domain-containing protein [Christiangramia sp. SM2212]